MNVYIYCLIDPRDQLVHYVGKTSRLKRRLQEHVRDFENNRKFAWITNMKEEGHVPIMDVLETTTIEECDFWEVHWMNLLKSWNMPLTNMTEGGDGCYGRIPWNKGLKGVFKHSVESKMKMREARIGQPVWLKGYRNSKEKLDIIASKLRGRKRDVETIEKVKRAVRDSWAKKVFCYNNNGSLVKVYDSIVDTIADGFDKSAVCGCCKGKKGITKGHYFSYKTEDKNHVLAQFKPRTSWNKGIKGAYKASESTKEAMRQKALKRLREKGRFK